MPKDWNTAKISKLFFINLLWSAFEAITFTNVVAAYPALIERYSAVLRIGGGTVQKKCLDYSWKDTERKTHALASGKNLTSLFFGFHLTKFDTISIRWHIWGLDWIEGKNTEVDSLSTFQYIPENIRNIWTNNSVISQVVADNLSAPIARTNKSTRTPHHPNNIHGFLR